MAITAETGSRAVGTAMALETLEPRVVVPRPFAKIGDIGVVDRGICAPDAVIVPMAPWLRTCHALIVMAGRTRFYIATGGLGVSLRAKPWAPGREEVVVGSSAHLIVTIVAEGLDVVTILAFGLFAFGVKAMVETIVKIVHGLDQVIAGMAIAAESLAVVAWLAVLFGGVGIEFMRVLPVRRMEHLGHLHRAGMAKLAFARCGRAVMTLKAPIHGRVISGGELTRGFVNVRVARQAYLGTCTARKMPLMRKNQFGLFRRESRWVIRVGMTQSAIIGRISYGMAFGADVMPRDVFILYRSTGQDPGMAIGAGYTAVDNVRLMVKYYSRLGRRVGHQG